MTATREGVLTTVGVGVGVGVTATTRRALRGELGVPGDAPARGELAPRCCEACAGAVATSRWLPGSSVSFLAGDGLRAPVDGEREGRGAHAQQNDGEVAAELGDARAHRLDAVGRQARAALGEVALVGGDGLLVAAHARVRRGEVVEHHRDGAQPVGLLEGHDGVGEAARVDVGDAAVEGCAGLGVGGRGLREGERGREREEGGEDGGAEVHS
ncbi:MAG: hypothetical protein IPF99_01335 [Deltaproteobacteria bacterium]|nr:hypothetical protein [Deltaproteobacteria bacterium]